MGLDLRSSILLERLVGVQRLQAAEIGRANMRAGPALFYRLERRKIAVLGVVLR
jgi:hypothetical protein